MSTYWYYECLNHTPPLSGDEFTQHTDDYAFKRGIELAQSRPISDEWWDSRELSDDYFTVNACRFLVQHPTCELGIYNEYGEHRAIDGQTPRTPLGERQEIADRLRALANEHNQNSHYFMSYDADFLHEVADRISPASAAGSEQP